VPAIRSAFQERPVSLTVDESCARELAPDSAIRPPMSSVSGSKGLARHENVCCPKDDPRSLGDQVVSALVRFAYHSEKLENWVIGSLSNCSSE
jgi:hypothetical protein